MRKTVKQAVEILADRGIIISEDALRGHIARDTISYIKDNGRIFITENLKEWKPGSRGWKKGVPRSRGNLPIKIGRKAFKSSRLYHAVRGNIALCGTKPGKLSCWCYDKSPNKPTCKNCLARL